MGELEGRVAIVTGAGSGMGRAISVELSTRGATIAALDVQVEAAERTVEQLGGGAHVAVHVDVTRSHDVDEAVAYVKAVCGGVDLLCNAAGIADQGRPTHELSDDDWHRILDVDLHGPFYLCRACVPAMLERGGGAIVNISSAAGVIAVAGGAAYTAAKHGLLGLTKRLAAEYGPMGIHVNAVCPGFVATEMNEPFRDMPSLAATVMNTPAGRWAQPQELAKLVAYLLGPDASYLMGACVLADGGWTIV
jgi:3-oxoacyl-[acyl-carrier protein] reductase